MPNTHTPIRCIAWVGTGALGLYYASRQVKVSKAAGTTVNLLVRSGREQLAAEGLTVASVEGDYRLPPEVLNLYSSPEQIPKADLVCIGLKATGNAALPELVGPLLHEGTHVLTLQNGLGNEQFLAGCFGAERVLGACAFVAVTRDGPTHLTHSSEGFVHLGELAGPPTARTAAVAAVFTASGIRVKELDSLAHGRWEKLIWNIAFNGIGAARLIDTGTLLSTPAGEGLVREVMAEVIAIAAAEGCSFPADIIDRKIAFTRPMKSYRTSMQVDRELGRAMEVEVILSEPLRRADRLGVAAPRLRELESCLRTEKSSDSTSR